MSDTTARIAAKGLQSTGVTEDLARKYHDNLGMSVMAIVELQATSRTEDSDGKQTVQLNLLSVEPAVDQSHSDHLRELQRALYRSRQDPGLTQEVEQSTDDVVHDGRARLLTCSGCLHPRGDERIDHTDEDDDGWCAWSQCGHAVNVGDHTCAEGCEMSTVPG